MNFPFFVARRYFFARSIPNVIHIIAGISLLGITITAMALITILSVFNGFEDLVSRLYHTFDPDLKIIAERGKFFSYDSTTYNKLKALPFVDAISPVLEDNLAVLYHDQQSVATFKALEPEYLSKTGIDTMLMLGDAILQDSNGYYALVGSGVRAKLGLPGPTDLQPLQVVVPRSNVPFSRLLPSRNLVRKYIHAAGVFSIQQDFDSRYIILPMDFARSLIEEPEKVTSIEIRFKRKTRPAKAQEEVEEIMGEGFVVLNRQQQQPSLYRVMKIEKFAVYLLLTFVLLIAAFNLVGALLMLAIEKRTDMMILESFGATPKVVERIIFYEGLLLSLAGGIIGLFIGLLLGWLQIQFGFVKISRGGSTFVVDAYPVKFELFDFVLVLVTVVVMGLFASWFPAKVAYKRINAGDLKGNI